MAVPLLYPEDGLGVVPGPFQVVVVALLAAVGKATPA